MMHRHQIELWTDEGTDSVLVTWIAEAVDQADVVEISRDLELRGSNLWAARTLGSLLTLALLYGPEKAARRALELERRESVDPTLF